MAQQIPRQRLGVRRDVEPLVGGDAGVRARGDVPHRVAARLARRHPGVGEPAHRRLDVVQLHEVELDVLPGRDVAEAARVPLADVGERVELLGGQDALRDLDAQHLRVRRPAAGRRCRAPGGTRATDRASSRRARTARASSRTRRCRLRSRTTAARGRTSSDRLPLTCCPLDAGPRLRVVSPSRMPVPARHPSSCTTDRRHVADHDRAGAAAVDLPRRPSRDRSSVPRQTCCSGRDASTTIAAGVPRDQPRSISAARDRRATAPAPSARRA